MIGGNPRCAQGRHASEPVMTQQPPPPATPASPAARFLRTLLRRLALLALVVVGGYVVLVIAWVLLNPRW
jgi:hypothetical protein